MNLRKTLLVIGIGPLVGFIEVAGWFAYYSTVDTPVKWSVIVWTFVSTFLWGLFLPLVVHWSERDPLRLGDLKRLIPLHTARAVLVSCGTVVVIGLVRWAAHALFGSEVFTPIQLLGKLFNGWLVYDLFMYALLLGIVSAVVTQRELRAKELDAARLEAALSQTEMKLLKAELDPHFIFNALHTITSLVHRDPDGAERMLCRLSDFLRLTFATTGALEVPLQQELEHLESYMAIQMVRFRGRLFLDTDVPPELLGCRVPNLLLQPLVENIVKHAVSPSHRPVHARLRARREGARLLIEVLDDGPGLPIAGPMREGVGLANTRGRLRKLYGESHNLILENRAPGGTRALVDLPYSLMPLDAAAGADGDRRGANAESGEHELQEKLPHAASAHR